MAVVARPRRSESRCGEKGRVGSASGSESEQLGRLRRVQSERDLVVVVVD